MEEADFEWKFAVSHVLLLNPTPGCQESMWPTMASALHQHLSCSGDSIYMCVECFIEDGLKSKLTSADTWYGIAASG